MNELSVIGLSHRTAPVGVREQFALAPDEVADVLRSMHRQAAFEEALLLSTCNRTELYFVARGAADPAGRLLEHVARVKGARPEADAATFYRHDGPDAVRHLFRVAASLDSQIVGEHEILGQVKEAYRLAVESRMAGFLLNKLLHRAFRAGKRVRAETALGHGAVGVPQAAVELARQVFRGLSDATVLVVGAGEAAETAARALVHAGVRRLIVANRTEERARALAEKLVAQTSGDDAETADAEDPACPALARREAAEDRAAQQTAEDRAGLATEGRPPPQVECVGFDRLADAVDAADLVLASTQSPEPVLTWDALADRLRRRGRSLLIIDIAVPRDADERLASLPNVFLYNIDALDRLVAESLRRRQQEVPLAESIVEDELRQVLRWYDSLQVTPTIRQLQEHVQAMQEAMIDRFGRQFSRTDREQLVQFTAALCSRLLHQPVTFLREVSAEAPTSEVLATIETIRRLFGLNGSE